MILHILISEEQSAFVPVSLITDNVIVAYECVHALRVRKRKKPLCAIKLDMHKAYDRVEWSFLKAILVKLGFKENWVNLIMQCVSSVEYRIRVNTEETDSFKPTRGLRQGDPLSPYLFLLCTEGLTALLAIAEERVNISGVKVSMEAPSVSNLLFADDSLILMRANAMNAEALRAVLNSYYAASGQMVSVEKSSIFFSPNTSADSKTEICQELHIDTEALSDKYLGLPAMVGADRSDCFRHFYERIKERLQGWMEKQLSIGGKEILIKSVA